MRSSAGSYIWYRSARSRADRRRANETCVVVEIPDDRAGTGTYARQLADNLEKLPLQEGMGRIKVVRASYHRLPKERLGRHLSRLLNGFRMVWWTQIRLPQVCRREHADILHCTAFVCPLFSPRPVVLTVHDLTHQRYPDTMDPLWRRYLVLFLRASLWRAARVVTVSAFSAREIGELYPEVRGKTSYFHLAALPRYREATNPADVERRLTRLGVETPYFLSLAAQNPRKNLAGLVAAYDRFKKGTNRPHKLVLAGQRGLRAKELDEVLAPHLEVGDVLLTGYVDLDDLLVLYQAAEALVVPSWYEGFGLPVLEAMASGCPVIASNVSALPEIAGDAALLVPPGDPAAIADAMTRIATDDTLRQQCVERGREQAACFSFDRMAHQTARLYAEILES